MWHFPFGMISKGSSTSTSVVTLTRQDCNTLLVAESITDFKGNFPPFLMLGIVRDVANFLKKSVLESL